MQSPLKALRLLPLSDSWQLGSPLPTPISLPGPVIIKATSFDAVGTSRPCASCTSTVTTDRSSPSPEIFARSGRSTIFAGAPVVSRFSVSTTLPSFVPRASITPGTYFTFHSTCELCVTDFDPWLAPFRKSSTLSRLLWHHTLISWPSLPAQFQCGKRCSTGFAPHHA